MGGARTSRLLVHASGFTQSPYADLKPAGGDVRSTRGLGAGAVVPDPVTGADQNGVAGAAGLAGDDDGFGAPPRKLWHSSPGSSGH